MIILTSLDNNAVAGVYPDDCEIKILSNGYPYIVQDESSFPPDMFGLYYGVEGVPDNPVDKYGYTPEDGFFEINPYGISNELLEQIKDDTIQEVQNELNAETAGTN